MWSQQGCQMDWGGLAGEPRKWHMCAHTSDLQSLPAQWEEGTGLCACLWSRSYIKVLLKAETSLHSWPCPCPCPVCVLCIWDTCSPSLQKGKRHPQPSTWAGTTDLRSTGLGSSNWAGRSPCPAPLLTTLNNNHSKFCKTNFWSLNLLLLYEK